MSNSAKEATQNILGASFRDPAGFIFKGPKGEILRQINKSGSDDYELFMESGLYKKLVDENILVKHTDVSDSHKPTKDGFAVIKPVLVPFISYPFEWSFSQLKDAALLTLRIQKLALDHGMSLKDASAYNIQFLKGKPVFIDTLSFEKYEAGKPWQAYRQFCQHFLAPLSLMSYTDIDLSQLLRVQLDGLRLDLASKLLPRRAKLKPGIAMHIVLHGKAQKSKESDHKRPVRKVSRNALLGIIGSLDNTVNKLTLLKADTEWGSYYDHTNYSPNAADKKAKLISDLVKPLRIKSGVDLGGNNGFYTRTLNSLGINAVCADIDPNAVEANYQFVKHSQEENILPLLIDLTNPGGALGWGNDERESIHERLKCDLVMALALIHHLAISNNLPLEKIADYFKNFGPYLVIEFVPKQDSQVIKLLSTREDIFPEYNEEGFVKAFSKHYKLLKTQKISGTKRTLYLFRRK